MRCLELVVLHECLPEICRLAADEQVGLVEHLLPRQLAVLKRETDVRNNGQSLSTASLKTLIILDHNVLRCKGKGNVISWFSFPAAQC